MAHANGIPTNDVYEIDASRQTTRMSANVSGFANTMRITLNDNLLKRGSPEEIQAVMGHEMGHYVMNHIPKFLFFLAVCDSASRLPICTGGSTGRSQRWGARWEIREVERSCRPAAGGADVGVLFFVLTPVMNTVTRIQEKEADMFGLNAARQPDGFAQAAIHLWNTARCGPAPSKNLSSSITPADTTAFTPPWCGRARIWSCSRRPPARPAAPPANPPANIDTVLNSYTPGARQLKVPGLFLSARLSFLRRPPRNPPW